MSFQTIWRNHRVDGRELRSCCLMDGQGTAAEIWPDLGSICLSWRVATKWGPLELLSVGSDWLTTPQRSGIPVLFPFPNRIRGGRFSWAGRDYSLPLNDPTRENAIHGFACRSPWRVMEAISDSKAAHLVTQFQLSADAPLVLEHWPGDVRLTLTFELTRESLSLVARVDNPGRDSVPVGLGFHPYFRIPFTESGKLADCFVRVLASEFWDLDRFIPKGAKSPVDGRRDLRMMRCIEGLELDDIYTGFPAQGLSEDLSCRGWIQERGVGRIEIWTSAGFREVVVFTPAGRSAICLEPYTCTTDAINLYGRGIDSGLQVLPPGAEMTETVQLRFVPSV